MTITLDNTERSHVYSLSQLAYNIQPNTVCNAVMIVELYR